MPWLTTIPLNQGMTWDPTWKALPTHNLTERILELRVVKRKGAARGKRSVFTSLAYELSGFQFLMQWVHAYGQQWSMGILWPHRVRYPRDENKKLFSNWDLEDFERKIGPYLPSPTDLNCPPIVGCLCSLVEGGGKRRIIAIGNYINQRLLRPVHDWLMQVLSHIPQDGTFDQTKPLDNLVGSSVCYSFDLKSASQITTRAFFVVI